ncbi:hypothetical protein B0H21DRAFT_820429 [Amylocystis lapponica]|nr:hypothetical protein B0H21DRAFT_820429 [Amylocystis lapponica]
MTKTVTEFTAKRITYETSVPVTTVVRRLNEELSQATTGPTTFDMLSRTRTKQEIEDGMHKINGGKDFACAPRIHLPWFGEWTGKRDTPEIHLYEFGNPLIVQTMLQHDFRAGCQVPPRILEKADRSGTHIIYVAPSTLIVVPEGGAVNTQLKETAEALDVKVERLVVKVTSV